MLAEIIPMDADQLAKIDMDSPPRRVADDLRQLRIDERRMDAFLASLRDERVRWADEQKHAYALKQHAQTK